MLIVASLHFPGFVIDRILRTMFAIMDVDGKAWVEHRDIASLFNDMQKFPNKPVYKALNRDVGGQVALAWMLSDQDGVEKLKHCFSEFFYGKHVKT